ncbi:MAG: hypothetical protein GY839_14280 [candidate division Zixibacteria bacterium]|nr:hypothetical protein [candidate division Zixibacteria bacterium]
MNFDNLCKDASHKHKLCWISMLANPRQDLEEFPLPDDIQDNITICHECDQFKDITSRGFGRRAADEAIILTTIKLMEQLAIKKDNLEHTANQLRDSLTQLSLLNDITDTLARSDKLEKSLRIILTGATSGDAFRFNRAAVFLINDKTGMLEGKCAIGPENREEAKRIWSEISKIPISRLLEEILIQDEFIPCSLESAISKVKLSLKNGSNPFRNTFYAAKEMVINTKDASNNHYDYSWWPKAGQLTTVPLVAEGKPLGLILADNAITGEDITPESVEALKSLANACAPGLQNAILRNKLQVQIRELERINELFKANQAYLVQHERLADVGMLATKVAHEFRVPLVSIGGYARRILKTIGTDKFDPQMAEIIISEVDRLTNISSEILEYSGSAKLQIKNCNLNDIITQSLDQLEEKLVSSGVETEKKFIRKNLTVKVDPDKFKQVVLNLVDNAVDAMDKGGKLKVKTSRHKEYIVLDIVDNGEGIDKRGLDNLFNLFYTTKNRGTGLGLPVSKKIIDDHGGNIVIKSNPGKGSVFSVRLPAK